VHRPVDYPGYFGPDRDETFVKPMVPLPFLNKHNILPDETHNRVRCVIRWSQPLEFVTEVDASVICIDWNGECTSRPLGVYVKPQRMAGGRVPLPRTCPV
jgi:hypothetical protein